MIVAQWVRALTIFALTTLLVWGCSRSVPPIPMREAPKDQLQKIAVLSPYGLDLLLSLGEQPAAYAGVSASRQPFNRPIEQIPFLGNRVTTQPINLGDRSQPSLEALALLKPDLILGERWQGTQGKNDLLTQIAPTVLLDDQYGWQKPLQQVAQVIDRATVIPLLMAARKERITKAREKLAAITNTHPRVLLLSSGDLASGFYAFGQERSVYTDLIEALGFRNVRLDDSRFGGADAQISIEILPQIETDILIVIGWNENDADERPLDWRQLQQAWNQIPLLKTLPISQTGQVYFMDAYLTMVRGPLAEVQILNDLLQQLAPIPQK
ncbi:iron-siderophore ABC transporter substrate-binding protein [Phormidesmis sp. 146-35]